MGKFLSDLFRSTTIGSETANAEKKKKRYLYKGKRVFFVRLKFSLHIVLDKFFFELINQKYTAVKKFFNIINPPLFFFCKLYFFFQD